jgi:hypothetical protein
VSTSPTCPRCGGQFASDGALRWHQLHRNCRPQWKLDKSDTPPWEVVLGYAWRGVLGALGVLVATGAGYFFWSFVERTWWAQ